MTVYWLLLLPTALIAYLLGSLDSMVLASNFVFRRNLARLGKGNIWISNFRRIYGVKGALKLLAVELVRDMLPILIGGGLLAIKGHGSVGFVFAGFCLVMGRLFPLFYELRGGHAALCLVCTAMMTELSAGIATLLMMVVAIAATRYISVGTVVGALTYAIVTVMVVDESVIVKLAVFIALAVVLRHIPSFIRIVRGTEERLTGEEDITYKLDE